MTPPAVSVLLLLYNRPQFMRQAIESVLAQTFADFEFIVLDHASETPEPFAIAREYAAKDSRMRVLRAEENRGVSAGRNFILREAKGEFVATIEDDDYWAPEKLQKQTAFMRAHPEAAVCCCSLIFINGRGKEMRRDILRERIDPPSNSPEKIQIDNYRGSGQLFLRGALHDLGGWRPWFAGADDVDLYFRLEEKHHRASIADCLLYFRRHGSNLSRWRDNRKYHCAAAYSALCRREGKPDPVEEGATLESLLPDAFVSSAFSPHRARKVIRVLLRERRYAELRRLLVSHRQNKHYPFAPVKTYLKLAMWSLRYNRLGFWLS